MAESVECYEVLVRHTADLQLAVRENLTSLGSQLVAAKIITLDQYEEIRNPHRPVNERGADLVKYVQNKVRRDSRHYHAFIDALKSDLSQYGDILMKLEETRLSVASEQQPVIPQLPPPREDDNPLPAQGILLLLTCILAMGIGILSLGTLLWLRYSANFAWWGCGVDSLSGILKSEELSQLVNVSAEVSTDLPLIRIAKSNNNHVLIDL